MPTRADDALWNAAQLKPSFLSQLLGMATLPNYKLLEPNNTH